MKEVVYTEFGSPDVIQLKKVDKFVPKEMISSALNL